MSVSDPPHVVSNKCNCYNECMKSPSKCMNTDLNALVFWPIEPEPLAEPGIEGSIVCRKGCRLDLCF